MLPDSLRSWNTPLPGNVVGLVSQRRSGGDNPCSKSRMHAVGSIDWKRLDTRIYTYGSDAITISEERYQFRIRTMDRTNLSHRDHVQRDRLHFARVGW